MVEVLIVLILSLACVIVIGMIVCNEEVTYFAKEMFDRIIRDYDKKRLRRL